MVILITENQILIIFEKRFKYNRHFEEINKISNLEMCSFE